MRRLTWIISMMLCLQCFSQQSQLQALDSRLAAMYDKLSTQPDDPDQPAQSKAFMTTLMKELSKEPLTLGYSFPLLREGLRISTSDDGLLRIYSWDDLTGGTMRFYRTVFQYKSGNVVMVKSDGTGEEGDPEALYSGLYTMMANGKAVYLTVSDGRFSSRDLGQTIKAWSINEGSLEDARIIKTKSGLTNSISINYDFTSVADRPERPVKLITYDAAKKIIYIPVVYPDGKVTSRFIQYQFTGQCFEKVQAQSK